MSSVNQSTPPVRTQRMQRGLLIGIIITLAFFLCLLASAPAHEVWVDDSQEGKVFVRFAEYGEDFEKSPGHLDGLFPVTAWTPDEKGAPNVLEAEKKEDGYEVKGAAAGQSLLVEAHYAVMKRGEGPARKPIFYARWYQPSLGAVKPALNFDIVPTGKANEVQVFFRGKPLAEAKVTLVTPEPKEVELTGDAEGKITFQPDKAGNYLLYGKHQREDVAGFAAGVAFDAISHNCSLIWKQP